MKRNGITDDLIVRVLSRLLDEVRSPDGDPFTYVELAARAAAHGHDLSAATIRQLRSGQKTNPTLKTLIGLAAAFGVPPSRLLEAADPDEDITAITVRTANLTDRDRRVVAALIRTLEVEDERL